MTEDYKIILADDHPLFRSGVKNLILQDSKIKIIGEASDGKELLDLLHRHTVDLVILDLSMPEMHGMQALEIIKKRHPKVRILVLTMHKEREFIKSALAKGVHGYILKSDEPDRILSAIQEIRRNQKAISQELISLVMNEFSLIKESQLAVDILTRREKEILTLVVNGQTSKSIALGLGISKKTVDNHRANIMEKLQFKNMAELIKFCIAHGIE